MNEKEQAERVDLRVRTKHFALRVIRMFSALPKRIEAEVIGKQVLRSGTSVGANFREHTVPDRMPNLSQNLVSASKSWKNPATGSSCFAMRKLSHLIDSGLFKTSVTNLFLS